MKVKFSSRKRSKGFLLLEVVLALGVFAIACTGLTVAFHRMADAAKLAQSELRITRILDSALTEQLSFPTVEESVTQIPIEGTDIELDVVIEPIENLENQDGEILQQMFHITVTANWFENGSWQSRSAETWRYNLMYQP
ncbi:MAG: type II secretion system protein [Akkermansiaceae bacterium]|nr:type II secretion system protein [Akkermansiaceae bacterium]